MENKMQLTDERLTKLHQIEGQLESAPVGKLYVWGTATTAQMITSFVTKNSGLSVSAYVVDDAWFREGTFLDKPIIKASDFLQTVTEHDWVIFGFTGSERAKEMEKKLPSFLRTVYFSFPYSANVDGTWLDLAFYEQYKERFESTKATLFDNTSKQVMDAFIKACMTGNTEELDGFLTEGQYFNELTSSCKPGCFVDCGAYIGDTIECAADFLGDRLNKVIAFEPDPDNLEKLKERMKKLGIGAEKLKLLQKGSYDEAATLRFSSSDSSSGISEDGDVVIETDSVDHAAEGMGEITFIKMDVEGSEQKSLLGAADTVKKYRPILAVCVYHKPEDLFALPELIRNLTEDKNYRYYLKYHGPDLRELVFYAIPQ
ncbi:MAG: FkbM family methyltransferase [Lachnospiraceae bacterium]|nr:FkbM family methyltransferase [Lachnospiraceae bacterium]